MKTNYELLDFCFTEGGDWIAIGAEVVKDECN